MLIGPRDAEFSVRMSADSGLQNDEVVRIARRERQIADLGIGDRAADIRAGRFNQRRTPAYFDRRARCSYFQLTVDHSFGTGVQCHARVSLGLETGLLDGHRISAKGQVRKVVVALVRSRSRTDETGVDVFRGDGRLRDRGAGFIHDAAANTAIDGLSLRTLQCSPEAKSTIRRRSENSWAAVR